MKTVPFSNETTSLWAAASLDYESLARMERLVLSSCLDAYDKGGTGLTGEELKLVTGLRINSVTARVRALVLSGRLADSGVKRKNASGRRAIVWRPTFRDALLAPKQTHGRIAAAVAREREEIAIAVLQWRGKCFGGLSYASMRYSSQDDAVELMEHLARMIRGRANGESDAK